MKEMDSYISIKQKEVNEKSSSIEYFCENMKKNDLEEYLEDRDFKTQYEIIKDKVREAENRDLAINYVTDLMKTIYEKSKKKKKCAVCCNEIDEKGFEIVSKKCQKLSNSKKVSVRDQKAVEDLKKQKLLFKGMKGEYEEFRRNKVKVEELKKEIEEKKGEKYLAQQDVKEGEALLENYKTIQNLICKIYETAEKIENVALKKIESRNKADDIIKVYPNIHEYQDIDQLEVESQSLLEEISVVKNEIESLKRNIEIASQVIQRYVDEREEKEKAKSRAEKAAGNLAIKSQNLKDLSRKKEELQKSVDLIPDEINSLNEELKLLEEEKKKIASQRKRLDDTKEMKVRKLEEYVEEFHSNYTNWLKSHDKNTEHQDLEARKQHLKRELNHASTEINDLSTKMEVLKGMVIKNEETIKLLDANIRLKSLEKEIEMLNVERGKLRQVLQDLEANEKYNKNLEMKIAEKKINLEVSDSQYVEKKKNCEAKLMEIQGKWTEVEQSYIEATFRKEVNQHVIEDLNMYIDNLQKALMTFHHDKMEEINEVITETWIKMYRGGDITKIQIKSDTEPNAKNASFNYRVVFFNADGRECDMKGRCSMGQKIIASIVIRLSLVQVFCKNCGVLALDDPTAGLDKDNVKRLAKQLNRLIENRKDDESFQLIIITHDENFLEEMSQYAKEYYRVFKDDDFFSKIEKFEL